MAGKGKKKNSIKTPENGEKKKSKKQAVKAVRKTGESWVQFLPGKIFVLQNNSKPTPVGLCVKAAGSEPGGHSFKPTDIGYCPKFGER